MNGAAGGEAIMKSILTADGCQTIAGRLIDVRFVGSSITQNCEMMSLYSTSVKARSCNIISSVYNSPSLMSTK